MKIVIYITMEVLSFKTIVNIENLEGNKLRQPKGLLRNILKYNLKSNAVQINL